MNDAHTTCPYCDERLPADTAFYQDVSSHGRFVIGVHDKAVVHEHPISPPDSGSGERAFT